MFYWWTFGPLYTVHVVMHYGLPNFYISQVYLLYLMSFDFFILSNLKFPREHLRQAHTESSHSRPAGTAAVLVGEERALDKDM